MIYAEQSVLFNKYRGINGIRNNDNKFGYMHIMKPI